MYTENKDTINAAQYGTDTYNEDINNIIKSIDVDLEYEVSIKNENKNIEVYIKK